jgi:hypothetical protein
MSAPDQNYVGLDAAILSALKQGYGQFKTLCNLGYIAAEASKHATPQRPEWRVIDARLQSMRKAGKIRFARSGVHAGRWLLVEGGAA